MVFDPAAVQAARAGDNGPVTCTWRDRTDPDVQPIQKHILVTGGAGYIGGCLVRQLLADGYRIRVLDSMLYGDGALADLVESPDLTIVRGDVRNRETVRQALAGVNAVVHLAAIVGDPACSLFPAATLDINQRATSDLATLARDAGIERFILASTCSVYGAGSADLDEDAPVNPLSLYAETKLASERDVLARATNRFRPTVLRFATLYGLAPRLRFDLVANLLIGRAVAGLDIEIHGGEQWRPFLHVQDAAGAIRHSLSLPVDRDAAPRLTSGPAPKITGSRTLAAWLPNSCPERSFLPTMPQLTSVHITCASIVSPPRVYSAANLAQRTCRIARLPRSASRYPAR